MLVEASAVEVHQCWTPRAEMWIRKDLFNRKQIFMRWYHIYVTLALDRCLKMVFIIHLRITRPCADLHSSQRLICVAALKLSSLLSCFLWMCDLGGFDGYLYDASSKRPSWWSGITLFLSSSLMIVTDSTEFTTLLGLRLLVFHFIYNLCGGGSSTSLLLCDGFCCEQKALRLVGAGTNDLRRSSVSNFCERANTNHEH